VHGTGRRNQTGESIVKVVVAGAKKPGEAMVGGAAQPGIKAALVGGFVSSG
jgi:hypothetical protein